MKFAWFHFHRPEHEDASEKELLLRQVCLLHEIRDILRERLPRSATLTKATIITGEPSMATIPFAITNVVGKDAEGNDINRAPVASDNLSVSISPNDGTAGTVAMNADGVSGTVTGGNDGVQFTLSVNFKGNSIGSVQDTWGAEALTGATITTGPETA